RARPLLRIHGDGRGLPHERHLFRRQERLQGRDLERARALRTPGHRRGREGEGGRVRADLGLDPGEGTLMAAKAPEAVGQMSGEEIVALCRKHTIFEWSVQPKVDPIPVARAEGVYFWTPE